MMGNDYSPVTYTDTIVINGPYGRIIIEDSICVQRAAMPPMPVRPLPVKKQPKRYTTPEHLKEIEEAYKDEDISRSNIDISLIK